MAALAVALGGALGALSRWSLNQVISTKWVTKYPLGTISANLLGCLLIGLAYGYLSQRAALRSTHALFLLTGFLGSFTTFSTYANDTVQLLHSDGVSAAAVNIAVQTILGVLFVTIGLWVAAKSV